MELYLKQYELNLFKNTFGGIYIFCVWMFPLHICVLWACHAQGDQKRASNFQELGIETVERSGFCGPSWSWTPMFRLSFYLSPEWQELFANTTIPDPVLGSRDTVVNCLDKLPAPVGPSWSKDKLLDFQICCVGETCLLYKPGSLSSIPGSHKGGRRTDSIKWSLITMHMLWHMCMCVCTCIKR